MKSYKIFFLCFFVLFFSRVEKGKKKLGRSFVFVFRISRPIKSDHVQIKDKTKNIVPESSQKIPGPHIGHPCSYSVCLCVCVDLFLCKLLPCWAIIQLDLAGTERRAVQSRRERVAYHKERQTIHWAVQRGLEICWIYQSQLSHTHIDTYTREFWTTTRDDKRPVSRLECLTLFSVSVLVFFPIFL